MNLNKLVIVVVNLTFLSIIGHSFKAYIKLRVELYTRPI